MDRNVAPPATGLDASSINVGWNQLEPNGPGLVADNPIDTALLAADYTEAADQQCEQEEIDTANADWPTTRIGVSFNPYQTLVAATNTRGYTIGTDEAYTQQMMTYCRSTLGQRCVLENDSIRDPISAVGGTQPYYSEMYAAMDALGAPIAFQTATATGIGDFWETLEWAAQQHAASVELPLDGSYPPPPVAGVPAWQTLSEVSQWFQDVPAFSGDAVSATQGTSTAGDAVGTVTVSELAAYDSKSRTAPSARGVGGDHACE